MTPKASAIRDPSALVVSKEVIFDKMLVFSGYPETNSVHTDRAFARARGLPDAVAQGLQTYAYMCEWLVEYFGADWFQGGRLSTAFLAIVLPGDLLQVKAELTETREVAEGTEVTVNVWCENARADKVAAGVATAIVR